MLAPAHGSHSAAHVLSDVMANFFRGNGSNNFALYRLNYMSLQTVNSLSCTRCGYMCSIGFVLRVTKKLQDGF